MGIQIIFFVVFALIIFSWIITYIKNENSPIISTKAKLIDKRRNVHTTTNADGIMTTNETFVLIFELDTGSELKFTVRRNTFRSVPEYEWGTLTFQGTRFLKFQSASGIVEN